MLVFFSATLLGIALSFVHTSVASTCACAILGAVLFLYGRFAYNDAIQKSITVCVLLCIGLTLGQVRMIFVRLPDVSKVNQYQSKTVALVGQVFADPISDGEKQKIILHVKQVRTEHGNFSVDTSVILRANAYPVYIYGDDLIATGTLKVPEKIYADDGRVFDYQMYLLKDGITHTVSSPRIHKMGNTGNPILSFLFGIRRAFVASMDRVLPEPESGLLAGIVLGTDTLSTKLKDMFRTAGLSHIVVLSGYNITVVAEAVLAVASACALPFAFVLALVMVLLFVIASGSGTSALRAGVMAAVALLGKQFRKTYRPETALVLAVWGMVLWNPFILLYDPSFHLSVLATIGIMYMTPVVAPWFSKGLLCVTERFGLRDICTTTVGTQLFVMPYILYMSGNLPLFSFPANMIVLPFVPLTMFLGFFTAVFGFIWKVFAYIPGAPVYSILRADVLVVETVSRIPFANVHVPFIPVWVLVLTYIAFGIFLYRFHTEGAGSKQKSQQV